MIGNVHQFQSSGQTQASNYTLLRQSHRGVIYHTTLALSIVAETLLDASYYFLNTSQHPSSRQRRKFTESQEAIAFIRGTGLELIIDFYHLDFDPDTLRDKFYEYFKVKQ